MSFDIGFVTGAAALEAARRAFTHLSGSDRCVVTGGPPPEGFQVALPSGVIVADYDGCDGDDDLALDVGVELGLVVTVPYSAPGALVDEAFALVHGLAQLDGIEPLDLTDDQRVSVTDLRRRYDTQRTVIGGQFGPGADAPPPERTT